MTGEQSFAAKAVNEWVSLDSPSSMVSSVDDFGFQLKSCGNRIADKLVFELHSHSICSDGFLSPTALVERAHRNGVRLFSSGFYIFEWILSDWNFLFWSILISSSLGSLKISLVSSLVSL
ncbi:polymerase/histidinol phosphatase-like protein [Thalictrum thalictroides]|uniref:Polymerase/histidinol phosphatase-like protein n=1 Tax=Thalictrum thalictroides TaxID=46969 RepID=A0A7J6WPT2_THATH|nr:polymerase/histidinol phosphatase-like protein [Thalictrum thalictroides]